MRIFLKIDPPTATAQMKKVAMVGGRPRFYEPAKVKEAKSMLIHGLSAFKPGSPLEGPIELMVTWMFPSGKKHHDGEWRITRPDTDNLEKMLKDCMTELGFWKDDALVAREVCEKLWSDEPGIGIEINLMGGKKDESNS